MSCIPELGDLGTSPLAAVAGQAALDPTMAHHGSLFLRSLPLTDLRRIAPDLTVRVFSHDQQIQNDGEIIHSILFPHDMTVSLIGLTVDGHAIESASVGREGFVGVEVMLGSPAASCTAVARRGQASSIALERLLILTDQLPSLRAALLHYARSHLAAVARLAACNAVHTLRQRACRRLLLEMDQTDRRAVAITQEELARALGVSRTSANQMCRELRADGIIEYRRGRIVIRDREQMKNAACDCYTYLKRLLAV